MNMAARHDLPHTEAELASLAYLLEYDSSQAMLDDVETHRRQNRGYFEACVKRLSRQLAG